MSEQDRKFGATFATFSVTAVTLFAGVNSAAAANGEIVFYEGNGGHENIVHVLDDSAGQSVRPNDNDEARSVVLHNVRAGAVIEVFDDKKAKKTDDYAIIRVLKSSPEYIIRTFERTYSDEYVDVTYVRANGLDGKVSHIRVH